MADSDDAEDSDRDLVANCLAKPRNQRHDLMEGGRNHVKFMILDSFGAKVTAVNTAHPLHYRLL